MNHPLRIVVIGLLGGALAACGGTGSPPTGQGTGNTAVTIATSAPVVTAAATAVVPTGAATLATSLPATTPATTDVSSSATTGTTGEHGVTETVHVVVTGGPNAGTYDKRASDGGCSYGLAGAGSWGNQYSDANEKTSFSSLQLIVPNAKEAAAGTSKFLTTFTFGDLVAASSKNYNVDGRDGETPKGKGTVTVDDKGNTAVVTIHAEPQPDVKIEATIMCNEVMRNTSAESTPAPDTSATDQSGETDGSMTTATP